MRSTATALALLLAGLAAGCGIKGPPRPVDTAAPADARANAGANAGAEATDAGCCRDAPP